ncbi:MAG: MbnP family protein [Candidatus Cyclobacteriaceae bacterium M3_2C_046]
MNKALIGLSIFSFSIILLSCQDKIHEDDVSNDTLNVETNTLYLNFDHTIDGEGVVYNDIRYANDAGNRYSVMTLRYYISDIVLHQYDGEIFEIDTFHYRDIDFPETRQLIIDNVPNGEYTYISFIFGLDSLKNKSFGLPATQENNNMEWPIPMGGGYHYMKFEGRFIQEDGSTGSFNTHFGRLQTKDGKLHENFIEIILPNSAFFVNNDSWEVQVLMNLNEWYRTPHEYNIEEFGPAIMGNQQAQQILKENGADAFSTGYIFRRN